MHELQNWELILKFACINDGTSLYWMPILLQTLSHRLWKHPDNSAHLIFYHHWSLGIPLVCVSLLNLVFIKTEHGKLAVFLFHVWSLRKEAEIIVWRDEANGLLEEDNILVFIWQINFIEVCQIVACLPICVGWTVGSMIPGWSPYSCLRNNQHSASFRPKETAVLKWNVG